MIEIGIDPVAVVIGNFELRWYGILTAVAVAVLMGWMYIQIHRGAKISYDSLLGGALVGIPSGVIFARMLHVIDRWSYYSQNPGQIIGGEGLAIYGAILGAALGVWVYSRFVDFKYAYAADVITPGIILAQMVGRVGCVINGCCYGETVTDLPWGVVYTHSDCYAPIGIPVHPTNAYEIIFLGALFAFIMIFRSRFKVEGSQFLFYLGMYSLWRIGVGILRVQTPFLFGLEQAQVIGIVTAAICFPLLIYKIIKYRRGKSLVKEQEAETNE